MSMIVSILATINLILAFLVLGSSILLIKWHDKLRYKHFIFKKRVRVLRQFKELYYSYELYRATQKEPSNLILDDKQLTLLLKKIFIGDKLSFYEGITQEQKEIKLQEKMNFLDRLSDDFKVLYNPKINLPIQSFIFWYRIILSDFVNYKKNLINGKIEALENNLSLKTGIKQLEFYYEKINNLSLSNDLEEGVQIKE